VSRGILRHAQPASISNFQPPCLSMVVRPPFNFRL
jgi:hypothetical protein